MKSEPAEFDTTDPAEMPAGRASRDGAGNHQARTPAPQEGRRRDFFHRSSYVQPGVAGRMRIVREACPDPSQFDREQKRFDPDSRREAPHCSTVDVRLPERFASPVTPASSVSTRNWRICLCREEETGCRWRR